MCSPSILYGTVNYVYEHRILHYHLRYLYVFEAKMNRGRFLSPGPWLLACVGNPLRTRSEKASST